MSFERLTVDLHCHSHFSDGLPGIPAMEDWCLRSAAGLAITDHNEIRGAMLLAQRERVPCIPAIEVGTQEGVEFLVYFSRPEQLDEFYRRGVEPYLLSRFMVRSRVRGLPCLEVARELGAFITLAHPCAFGRKSIRKHLARPHTKDFAQLVLDQVDAIEVFNAGIPGVANRNAAAFYAGLDKLATWGSDAHTLPDLGNAGIVMAGNLTSRTPALFSQLQAGSFEPMLDLRYSSLAKTVAVIAWKHTSFFLLTRARFHGRHLPYVALEQ